MAPGIPKIICEQCNKLICNEYSCYGKCGLEDRFCQRHGYTKGIACRHPPIKTYVYKNMHTRYNMAHSINKITQKTQTDSQRLYKKKTMKCSPENKWI